MKNIFLLVSAATFVLGANACSTSHETPPALNKKPTTDTTSTSSTTKEKMLWFDAEANFERFSTKANITYFLDKTKETGFNKIVVDVKPVEGDALYESTILTKATKVGSVTVTRDWDYLQYFIDEAHKRNLKVTVSTTIFPMGMPNIKQGPVYRDTKWNGKTCMEYTPTGMLDIKNDPSKVAAFLNPVLTDVQDFAISFIKEIVKKYDFDAFALDYCRFPDAQSDFSDASRTAFETYIGSKVENWPSDIFTYDNSGNRVAGKYYKQWWEFRSSVIHDFVARVRTEIKAIKPAVKLEYWAASWWGALYANGQNWASDSFNPATDPNYNYYTSWCSSNYQKTGFASQLDTFLLGAYLSTIYGSGNNESIEYAINQGNRIIGTACKMYGTVQCADASFDIEEASYYCLKKTSGLMVFDIVHVINNNKWAAIKKGIDRAEAEMK